MVIPTNKRKVDAINNMVNPAPVVEPINTVSNGPVTEIKPTDTFTQNQNRQKELEGIIKSGGGSASVNAEYNRLTGNQQGSRDVMLGSTEAQKTMKTTITPEEAGFIAQSGVKDIGEGVKPDMTAGTKEDFKQAMDTTKVTTETTPTGTIKTTETPAGATKIENIDQFKQAGGGLSNLEQLVENRYGTIATQEADGSLTATIGDEKFKWTIDEAGNPKKVSLGKVGGELMQDADNIFNIMKSGGIVDKNSSNYQAVKDRFDKFKQYSGYGVEQLATLLSDGILLSGTTSYNDLYNDPATRVKLENAQKLNVINKKSTDINKIQESQSESILENKTNTINAFDDGVLTPQEYSAMLNSPEISAKSTEVEGKVNKYNGLKAQYDAIEDEVRADYKGYSENYIQARIAEQQKNMYKQIVIAQGEMNTAIGTLSELKNLQATIVETNLSLYNQQQAKIAQQEQLIAQQQFQTASDLRNFEQQKEILKIQQDYQDANIQTDLIQVGNKNVLINRKTGETIKSFDLPTQITKPEGPIKMGEDSLYDPVTQQWITKPSVTTSGITVTQGVTKNRPDRNNNPGNLKAGDVGYGVDDQNHTIFGSAEEGYKAMIKDITAKMTGNTRTGLGPNSTLAQLGKVYAEDPKWAASVSRLSGYPLNTKLSDIDVNKLAPAIAKQEGFTGTINQAKVGGKQYTDDDIALLGSITKLDKQGREVLKENGFTEQDWAKLNAGLLPPTNTQKETANNIIKSINELINHPGFSSGVGASVLQPGFTLHGTDKADFINLFNSFRDNLVLPNLGQLKGPMSDKDIQFLRNSATAINLDMSEKGFKNELNKLKNKYTELLNKGQVNNTGTSTKTGTQQKTDIKTRLQQLRNKTNP